LYKGLLGLLPLALTQLHSIRLQNSPILTDVKCVWLLSLLMRVDLDSSSKQYVHFSSVARLFSFDPSLFPSL